MADMPDKGFRSITVTEEVHKKLTVKADKEKTSVSFLASSVLASYMEADAKFGRYAPFLEHFGFEGNTAILWDHKKDRSVDVYLHDQKLHCSEDNSEECIHVAFCMALPQVRRVTRG